MIDANGSDPEVHRTMPDLQIAEGSIEPPIAQGEVSHHHRWWVDVAHQFDCYDLYVVRYTTRTINDTTTILAQYVFGFDEEMNPGWFSYGENEMIRPTYRFPGELVHLLTKAGAMVDRDNFAETVRQMVITLFTAVATDIKEDADAKTGSSDE